MVSCGGNSIYLQNSYAVFMRDGNVIYSCFNEDLLGSSKQQRWPFCKLLTIFLDLIELQLVLLLKVVLALGRENMIKLTYYQPEFGRYFLE